MTDQKHNNSSIELTGPDSNYFKIGVKPQLKPLSVAKISSSDKIEVKAKSPVNKYEMVESPSNNNNGGAPFA